MSKVDPITLEVYWNRLVTLMGETDQALLRTAFSTIISETRDFGFTLLDEESVGLAQSLTCLPVFAGILPYTARALLERFPHLHLDTTMAMTPVTTPYTGIDPAVVLNDDLLRHRDRIVFGSDFPNLPYPYEEERRGLWARDLPLDVYQRIFRENARRLFRLS